MPRDGMSGAMSYCPTTSISFVPRLLKTKRHWHRGSGIGKARSAANGMPRSEHPYRSGSAISGTVNCEAAKVTVKNGIMSAIIPCATATASTPTTGPTKAKSTNCAGNPGGTDSVSPQSLLRARPIPSANTPPQKPPPQKRTGRAHPSGGTDSVSPQSPLRTRPTPSANTPSKNPCSKNGRAEPIPPEGLTPSVPNLLAARVQPPAPTPHPKNPHPKTDRQSPSPRRD